MHHLDLIPIVRSLVVDTLLFSMGTDRMYSLLHLQTVVSFCKLVAYLLFINTTAIFCFILKLSASKLAV